MDVKFRWNVIFGLGINWAFWWVTDDNGMNAQKLLHIKIVIANLLITLDQRYKETVIEIGEVTQGSA